jgi:hypothetical protein
LWAFIAVLGLAAVALLCSVSADVASLSVFGSPGTQVVLGAVFLITMAGMVVGWRPAGTAPRMQQLAALLLSVAAGVTTALAVGFFASGEYAVIGVVLIESAIFLVVIAVRVHRFSNGRAARSVGAS